jgi:protein tyrosine/serine phosphatase
MHKRHLYRTFNRSRIVITRNILRRLAEGAVEQFRNSEKTDTLTRLSRRFFRQRRDGPLPVRGPITQRGFGPTGL